MWWLKGGIIVAIFLSLIGGGYYVKTVIENNVKLTQELEESKSQLKDYIKNIEEQKLDLKLLSDALEVERLRKNKVIERIITLDNRKDAFIKGEDKDFENDVNIEFKQGLFGITCATGNEKCKN